MAANRRLDTHSEHALVEQCRRQDMEAFGKVVDAYQSRVLGFVKRLTHGAEDALDITQEVFIRAFQGFSRFDGRSSLRTWLFRIAYNLCVDRARKDVRSPQETRIDAAAAEDEPLDFADSRWDPETSMMQTELYEVISAGIDSMSEKLRTVLILHDKEDLGYDEIAEAVGIPVGTVKSRLFLARAHLQSYVKRYWEGEVTGA